MIGLEMFPVGMTVPVDKAILDCENKYKYCLIQTSQKYYYISETVSIANALGRVRRTVMNVETEVLAHNLHEVVRATNLADWRIVIFPEAMNDSTIASFMRGYDRIYKAARFGVNSRDTTTGMFVRQKHTGVETFITMVGDVNESKVNTRAKVLLKNRCKIFDNKLLSLQAKDRLIILQKSALHSGTGDWDITEIALNDEQKRAANVWTRERNAPYSDLFYAHPYY